MFKKILLSLTVLLIIAAVYLRFGHLPEPLPADTQSSHWLEGGIYDVSYFDVELVDDTRPTQKNGD